MVKETNKTEGCRESAANVYHPTNSSHTWNCSSDPSTALMEINPRDITPTLVTGQHRFFSTLCFS